MNRRIESLGRLQPVGLPGEQRDTFITIYAVSEGETQVVRFAIGNVGGVFDLPLSEVSRLRSILAEDWLKEQFSGHARKEDR